MHESSLALSVLNIAKQEAVRHNVSRIVLIRLAVGPFTGLEWETFSAFFALAAEGTVAQGAVLERQSAPAQAICRACGEMFELHRVRDHCPACGSDELDCLGGRTFDIVNLEAERPENAYESGKDAGERDVP